MTTSLPATENVFEYKGTYKMHFIAFIFGLAFFTALNIVAYPVLHKHWQPTFFTKHTDERKKYYVVS